MLFFIKQFIHPGKRLKYAENDSDTVKIDQQGRKVPLHTYYLVCKSGKKYYILSRLSLKGTTLFLTHPSMQQQRKTRPKCCILCKKATSFLTFYSQKNPPQHVCSSPIFRLIKVSTILLLSIFLCFLLKICRTRSFLYIIMI